MLDRALCFIHPRVICPLCGLPSPRGIYCPSCVPSRPLSAAAARLNDQESRSDLYREKTARHMAEFQRSLVLKAAPAAVGLVGGRITSRAVSAGGSAAHQAPPVSEAAPVFSGFSDFDLFRPAMVVSATPGGLRLSVPPPPEGEKPAAGGGRRGDVCGFSPAARRRMMQVLSRFEFQKWGAISKRSRAACAMFVTLTYSDKAAPPTISTLKKKSTVPVDFVRVSPLIRRADLLAACERVIDAAHYKRDLTTFIKRLERMPGFAGCLWKQEIEPRQTGARVGELIPHYHMLLLFDRPRMLSGFRRWLSLSWFQVCGSNDPDHRAAGTNCQVAYGGADGRLFAYLVKYLGKAFKAVTRSAKIGRIWGVRGDLKLAAPLFLRSENEADAIAISRRLRRWGRGATIPATFDDQGRKIRDEVRLSGSRHIQRHRHYFRGITAYGPGLALLDLARGLGFETVLPPDGNRRRYNRKTREYDLIRGHKRAEIPPVFGAIPADCLPNPISALTSFLRTLNFRNLYERLENA